VYLRPDDPNKKFERDSPRCAAAQVEEERLNCVEVTVRVRVRVRVKANE